MEAIKGNLKRWTCKPPQYTVKKGQAEKVEDSKIQLLIEIPTTKQTAGFLGGLGISGAAESLAKWSDAIPRIPELTRNEAEIMVGEIITAITNIDLKTEDPGTTVGEVLELMRELAPELVKLLHRVRILLFRTALALAEHLEQLDQEEQAASSNGGGA